MSVLENLLGGRHARIGTNPIAEMLFLPDVRHAEVAHRKAVERIIDVVELEFSPAITHRRSVALKPQHVKLTRARLRSAPP